ncbi:amidohydrolase family protein [Nocardia australiensis]|uniref:amidohydrolase family protein n=1 Tax=Nocardia australiensis TaxID=2887191 RepID=UPI001D154EB0|nr:amidohydrolase family protein [Nocardia australiensis]
MLTPPFGDLGAAIDAWRESSATLTEESFHHRAAAALALLRNGTTAVRSHVDIDRAGHRRARAHLHTLGAADRIGSLEVGKYADFIIVDRSNPDTSPVWDP